MHVFTKLRPAPSALLLLILGIASTLHAQASSKPVSTAPATSPAPRTAADAITPTLKDPDRHAQFLFRAKEGEVGLLFLGDSITDAWPRLGENSWLQFAPFHPADFGVSGDRTEHVLWRIENGELDGIQPKVTVILIGTNNIARDTREDPAWTAAGVKKIVETVQ